MADIPDGRHRGWCFTINNPVKADDLSVASFMKLAKYGIVGKEVGDNGTPHLQGYIHLTNAITFQKVKFFLSRAHIELAGGNDQQNYVYCSKQNDFREWGVKSEGQGKRNDIKEITNLIKSGDITLIDVMFDHPEVYLRYSRSFEKMFKAVQPHRSSQPEVHWRWGLSGTGKTYYVIDKHGPENVYIKDGTMWWDGYTQQEAILIDDFDNNIPYRTLLRILHEYREQGQIKGGHVNINSPYIYITCEYPPDHYWTGNALTQVTRRLTSVLEIKKTI